MNTTKENTSEDNQSPSDHEKAVEVTKAFQAFVSEPFQKVSLRLEGLEGKVGHRDDRLKKLEERLGELEAKFAEISLHLKQLESQLETARPVQPAQPVQPPQADAAEEPVSQESDFDPRGLIVQAMAEALNSFEDDQNTIEQYRTTAGFWLERGKKLKTMINETAAAIDGGIAGSNQIRENLPEDLAKALENSQQGLNIIGRMLQRLVNQGDRLESLTEAIEIGDNLKDLTEDEWMELLEGEQDLASAQKKISVNLGRIKKSNYQLVSKAGELAEKQQKAWLDFIGKQVLPVLDGIVDGKNHTSNLVADLRKQHQESELQLAEWFKTYSTLSGTLLSMLNELGVYRMDIKPGMMIDFERHEPSSVEADPEMESEQIKEISRDGYDYVAQNGNRQTLRIARVVVIKNND